MKCNTKICNGMENINFKKQFVPFHALHRYFNLFNFSKTCEYIQDERLKPLCVYVHSLVDAALK